MSDDAITHLLNAVRLTGLTATRDGALVASVSAPNARANGYVGALAELGEEDAVPLTRGEASVSSPAVTADGHILFVSARIGEDGAEAGDGSLWSLPPRGEARQLASRPGGFGAIRTAAGLVVAELDVHSRARTEAEHATLWTQRTDAGVSAIVHSAFPTRFWDHDLGPTRSVLAVASLPGDLDGRTTRPAPRAENGGSASEGEPASLVDFSYAQMPEGRLLDWDLASDGSFAVATVAITRPDLLEAPQVWRIDLRGGAPTLLHDTDDPGRAETTAGPVSPDGRRMLLHRSRIWTTEQNLATRLQVLDLATGETADVWPEADQWFDPVWWDDDTIAALSDDLGRGSVWIGGLDDAQPQRIAGGPEQTHSFGSLQVQGIVPAEPPSVATRSAVTRSAVTPAADRSARGPEQRLVATASAVDVAPFPVAIDPTSGQVTALPNPADVLQAPGSLREIHTEAEDGTALRAWLRLPDGDGPHPLLVFAHGGPWGSWNAWTYRWNANPFVDAGFAVLMPDPAISTGYGQQMIDRGQQQLGGAPFTDIMTLTDAAIAEPDVDGDRQAFAGGSYGGYMANWVAGHTDDRFRCIVTHASLWDTEEMGRTTDNSGWDLPMRSQNADYSPHRFVDRIRVPMLVIHGDRDYRVPIAQGQHLWYDLLSSSATPTDADGRTRHRYLFFPDEGHWILGRGNAEVWYRSFIAFLRCHVPGLPAEPANGSRSERQTGGEESASAEAGPDDWRALLG